jgi:hypothetical protein
MARTRAEFAAAVRTFAPGGELRPAHIPAFNALADALGIPAADECAPRLDVKSLQLLLGVTPDGAFGQLSTLALYAKLTNRNAPAATAADIARIAGELGVPAGHIAGIRKVEAPRGAFDDVGRPSILYERHVFRRNTVPPGRFDTHAPTLSGGPYGAGGYGAFSAQYGKLAAACALDPEAAFRACSWGAFQVLGENAVALGYPSAHDMAFSLVASEAAHLDCFARFVRANGLIDELRACRPNDPASCEPFVRRYNGPGYKQFNYHTKLAAAIA